MLNIMGHTKNGGNKIVSVMYLLNNVITLSSQDMENWMLGHVIHISCQEGVVLEI